MATGQLMFEVGVSENVKNLDKVKDQLNSLIENFSKTKAIQLKVEIDNLDAINTALSKIGDSPKLRELRQEIELLNREFSKLAAGAGGVGDLNLRAANQDVAELKENWQSANRTLLRYKTDLEDLRRSRDLQPVGSQARADYQRQIATFKKTVEEQQKIADAAKSAYDKAVKDAGQLVDANTRAEASYRELKSSIDGLKTSSNGNVVGTDFANWAKEVQSVTASVRELVEQLQKMNTATSAQSATETTKAQTQAVLEESDAYKQLAKWREQAEKFFKTNKPIADQDSFIGHAVNGIALGDKTSLETIKQHIYLQKDENKLLAERKLLEEQIAKSNIRKHEQKTNYQDVLGVYDKVLNALQQIKQTEQTPTPKGGLFDPQKFTALQEAIDKIISEINRLKEAFSGIGEIKGMTQLTESMNALFHNVSTFKDVFSTLSAAVNLTPTSEYVKKLQTDFEAAQAKVQELTEKLTALAAAQNNVAESASKAGKSEKQIGDAQTALFNRYQKVFADIQNIKREIVEIQRSAGGGGPFGDKLGEYFSALNRIRNVVREIATAKDVPDAIAKGMSSELLARISAALANVKTQFKDAVSEAKAFNKAIDKGSSQAEARIRKLGMAFNELKNYMKANGGSEEMKRLQSEIQGAIQKMRQLMNAGNFAGAVNVYERLSGLIRQAASATKEFEKGQQGLSGSVSHANSNLQHQSQILSDLKTMAMQYLSVWGAQSFINNIIELGGQLEQQRLSIGAILQDTAQANHLFSQIKDLAIKSPFGVQQLDAMSKQLSAYGFQYSELYEWTKRLADISAATGTSVDRLALALGHVRAEGALSGYTLRQFSMGNIPLLQKLSENLGKTKQEIRKMTRNKEIGYEDVLNVLKQLTDEGGMFFEAQETMSQALNAKFKNLRDSFQIMYSEMAEGAPGDFLKGVAEVLTDISKSWRVLMPLILSGGATLGIWKLSTMALNHELERSGKLLVGNAISTSKYSMNQLRAIATTGRFTIALKGLGRALMSIGKFIFNPVTLGFAAVEGLIYLWSKHNDEVRRAKDLTKAYGEEAVESEKNIAKQLENVKPFSNKLDDSALKAGIDSMTESIKNYAINGQSIINGMFSKDADGNVMSLADKYQYLRGELEETIKVYKELKRVKDAFEYGITKSDSGWLDDNVDTDLTQYSEAYKKFVDDVTEYNSKYNNSIESAIKNAQNSDLAFREATKNMKSYGDMLAEFWSNSEKYQNAAQFMNNLFGAGAGSDDALNLNESFFGYLNKKNEAMKELDQFIANTEERLKEKGYDFSKELAPEQVGALLKMSKEWIEKHPEWENIYGTIKEKLEGRWPIKIVPDTSPVEEELPEWMENFQKELDKTGITLTADMSMEQIVDLMKKAYDQAQTTINKLGPVALTAKINVVGMSEDEIEAYNNPLSPNYNPEMYQWLKQLKGAYNKRDTVDAAAKKRGIKLEGMKKDGTHKAEKQNQEAAKAVREQVRVIKEAADAFQYWREKVGDKGAWEHVQKEFGDVLQKIGITATNIEDVREHLKKIPQTKEYQAITDKKVKTEIDKEIAKENDQYTRKDFERDTERFLSQTQIQLDSLTRAWDTFNSVREATGNIELAKQLSGVTYDEEGIRNLAEATRKKIEEDFAAAGAVTIPFDMDLSDKQIEDKVHAAFKDAAPKREDFEDTKEGLDAYNQALMQHESQIKGVIEETKKWRDLQRDMYKSDISVFTKAWNDDRDRYQQFTKAVARYDEEKQSLERLLDQWNSGEVDEYGNRKGISQAQFDRAFANITSRESWAQFKAQTGMDWLTSNIDKTSITTVRRMIVALKEYAATTQMSAEETEDWFKVLNQFTDREAILNPIQGVTQAIENYNRAVERRMAAQEEYNSVKDNANATPQQIAAASQHYDEAVAEEVAAFESLKKAINILSTKFTKFGSDLQSFGQQLGGTVGDIFGGFGQIFSSVGNGMNAIQNIDFGATGIFKVMGYAQTAMTLVGSMMGMMQGISSMIPTTDQLYEKYAAKQKSINQMREAVDAYRVAVEKARAEENGWIAKDPLQELREAYDVHGKVLEQYFNKLTEAQEAYVESASGLSKAIVPILTGVLAVASVVAGVFSGGTGGVALWGLGSAALGSIGAGAIAATLSSTVIAAIGAAVAAGAGAAIGQVLQSAVDAITYKDGQVDARSNMKVRTQHASFWRGEKTQNLEEWIREHWGQELFEKGPEGIDMIDLKVAQEVLDSGIALAGETKETLEKLMELREQYDEWQKQIRDYITDRFSHIADDMTKAIWDWLSNGENALDKFHEYASDTFRQIAQDAVNTFLKVTVLDKFQEQLENMYKAYSMKDKNGNRVLSEEGLMLGVASIAGEMASAFETALPMAENLATIIKDAFDIHGYDITNDDSSSSSSGKSIQSITEQTADLLAAYVNAIRADVSVIRTLDSKAVLEYWPSQIRLMTSGTQSLTNIEQHTLAIMRSSDAIERSNQAILDNINGLKSKTWSIPIA